MKEQIKQFAKELHISDLGVCEARIYTELYDILAQQSTPFTPPPEKRLSPFDFIPDAKSVIMCAFNYFNGNISGNISKYARGTDYHTVVKNKLAALCEKIEACVSKRAGRVRAQSFADSSNLWLLYLYRRHCNQPRISTGQTAPGQVRGVRTVRGGLSGKCV